MKKLIPYFYFLVGISIIIFGVSHFLENRDEYRIVLGFTTTNKYGYLIFRIIFAVIIIYAGINKLKLVRK